MYDPSAASGPSTPYSDVSSPAPPPRWSGYNTQFYPGAVVWHRGTYWRCEAPHLSDGKASPDQNLSLWTPLSSTTPYGQNPPPNYPGVELSQTRYPAKDPGGMPGSAWTASNPPPAVPASSGIVAPQPEHIDYSAVQRQAAVESHEFDDSPDSQGTVTGSTPPATRSLGGKQTPGGMSTAQFFSSKADESLRFLTAKQETSKARDQDEWKDELKGKRVWRVGGLGIWAYDQEEKLEKEKGALWRTWGEKGKGEMEWLEAARERTTVYNQGRGCKPLVTWKLVQPGSSFPFPPDALQIGHEGGSHQPLFAARAWYGGGMHLGKAGPHLARGACISYGGAEITLDTFEVLCAKPDPTLLKWMCFQHGESVRVEGWQPVEGGREKDGQSLFVAKGEWEGGEHPGKCRITDDHAHIGWGGGEVWIRPFFILAYNSATRR